jgi:hypothetical protein
MKCRKIEQETINVAGYFNESRAIPEKSGKMISPTENGFASMM